MTPALAYEWLAPKLGAEGRQVLDVKHWKGDRKVVSFVKARGLTTVRYVDLRTSRTGKLLSITAMLFSIGTSLAHAEEVCTRRTVYGRVLKVEPITSKTFSPTVAQHCAGDQCVNYVSEATMTERTAGYVVTYRIHGKTQTAQADEAPAGITVELLEERCSDSRKTSKR
jgi:uncharacterized protein YcfJ